MTKPTHRAITSRLRNAWIALAAVPYVPIAVYLGAVGWDGLFRGGIAPGGLLARTLPHWLIIAWTLAVALGCTFAVFGALTRRTRIESSGLVMLVAGAVIYGFGSIYELSSLHDSVFAGLVSFAIAGMAGIRMLVLSQSRRAQEKAHELIASQDDEPDPDEES